MTGEPGRVPTFRRATGGDAPAVLDLFDQAIAWFRAIGNTGQWGVEPFSTQQRQIDRVTEWLGQPGGWIAELPDLPVAGIVILGERTDYVPPVDEDELYVRVLLASRSDAARGVGRALLELADAQARAAGLSLLRVDCYRGGTGRLVRFYESCGYAPTHEFIVGEWPGQVLERRLV